MFPTELAVLFDGWDGVEAVDRGLPILLERSTRSSSFGASNRLSADLVVTMMIRWSQMLATSSVKPAVLLFVVLYAVLQDAQSWASKNHEAYLENDMKSWH